MKYDYKKIFILAVKTFIQAILAYFTTINVADAMSSKNALIGVIVAAGAAGISAVMNFVLELLKKSVPDEDELEKFIISQIEEEKKEEQNYDL